MSGEKPLALIAGAGPGLGAALMKRFADGGYQCVGMTRTLWDHDETTGVLVGTDLTNGDEANKAVDDVTNQYGSPSVVIHNTAQLVVKPFLELEASDFEDTWRSMVLSAVHIAHATLPLMVDNEDGGAMFFSGATASRRGGANFAAFASAKFALRGLAQSLARAFQSQGVHVGHIILDGIVDSVRSRNLHELDTEKMMQPDDIAETYWSLVHQPPSAWTHEIDLRAMTEKF